MSDIPPEAVEAAHQYCHWLPRDTIEQMLVVVEQAWPHDPPGRDLHSTTSSSTQVSTPAASYKYFGFGRGPSVVR